MRALHRALMGVTLAALLVFAVGAIHPWDSALAQHGNEGATMQHGHDEAAQHGEAMNPAEHIHAMIEHLELTDAQHDVLAQPFEEVAVAMQELHRLHEVIVAELTEEQQNTLAEMVHNMMGATSGDRHGEDADGDVHR